MGYPIQWYFCIYINGCAAVSKEYPAEKKPYLISAYRPIT